MRLYTLALRSAAYHWRPNLAVLLGAAVGTAALTGALIVGDSMRGSLRETALGRLGRVEFALVGQRFFREALAEEMAADSSFKSQSASVCTMILLRGSATHAESRTRANNINVFGVDDCFWNLSPSSSQGEGRDEGPAAAGQLYNGIVLNEALAAELHASIGEEILIRTQTPSSISTDTLFGRRDETVSTLREAVAAIIPATGLGAFSLNASQAAPRNVYIPAAQLQKASKAEGSANVILVAKAGGAPWRPGELSEDSVLKRHLTLSDYGLRMRVDEARGYASLESESLLIPMPVERNSNLGSLDNSFSRVLAHLANSIRRNSPQPSAPAEAIPYSVVAAIDPDSWGGRILTNTARNDPPGLRDGEILLNEWAAEDLGAKVGDTITLDYYVTNPFGQIDERSAEFTLRGILPLTGLAVDPGFVPKYEGITDTQNLADWDPPFPIDLRRIRPKDEEYWDQYRTTPKAFITLSDGQRLWVNQPERFGRLTSVRSMSLLVQVFDWKLTSLRGGDWDPAAVKNRSASLRPHAEQFSRRILQALNPFEIGFTWEPLRQRAEEASHGATDFGMLFIGFSSFLIISAAMLAALLFRLNIERRSFEIGLLLAEGFTPRAVTGLLVVEGLALAVAGGALGAAASAGYAWLMLSGLRSWWAAAVNAPFLRLHVSSATLLIGLCAGVIVAAASMIWAVRSLTHRGPRSLLAGATSEPTLYRRRRRGAAWTAAVSVLIAAAAVAYAVLSRGEQQTITFFLGGIAMLVASLAALLSLLRREPRGVIQRPGPTTILRLGLRGAPRNVQRSMLTAGLIASAAFVILALQAFRLRPEQEQSKHGGTGGFSLLAESAVALPYDLNTKEGRDSFGVDDASLDAGTQIMSFRLRTGDEASCLNLYRPTDPRILGVPDEFIARGGFRFAATTADHAESPWALLQSKLPGDVIPAIGDESAVKWQMHLGLGRDLVINDERGKQVQLRFVALLKNSALQNEVLIAEEHFTALFPSISGRQFFLIETVPDRAMHVEGVLERELERFGFDATSTTRRLADFLAVQNTYLSTFQTLGGIGLLLGAAGLAAVLLRSVWERRRELAVMQAVGFSRGALAVMILAENYALALAGLFAAALSAGVAIAPVLTAGAVTIPWTSLAAVLVGVAAVIAVTGMAALAAVQSGSVRASLHGE